MDSGDWPKCVDEMDEQVNPLERDHSLCVVLPEGLKKNVVVHGSKPVMDFLVTLCASHHLNPSDYTVEFLSPDKNSVSFKPNSPIGSLEAEKMVLKPKGTEEKMKRPYMPEATVRLLVSYNRSHKTVVRVSPRVPLEMLLPVICDKCEFDVGTTVLLREAQSTELLDLTRTLNDYGLREVFAKDTSAKHHMDYQIRAAETAEVISLPLIQDLPKKEKKPKNRGFFSFFRRKKKNHEAGSVSAPVSPGVGQRVGVRVNPDNVLSASTLPADLPKKRRAPQPPVGASQSVPNNLSTCHAKGAQRSAESTIRSTKRRAPPPPCATTQVECLNTLEELQETDQSPHPSQPSSSPPPRTRLHEATDPFLSSLRGRDLSDARCALAKVLTSSLSNAMLVKRLRNSAANFYVSSCVSMGSGRPDDGGFCVEHESVLGSDLPTENEWDDPLQRSRFTTFKVVPPKKPTLCDSEETAAVSNQGQVSAEDGPVPEVSLENKNEETIEGALCSSSKPENGMSPSLGFHHNQMKNSPASSLHDQLNSVNTESQKEEAKAPSEVIQSESSECSNEEVNSNHHTRNEDQQSPSPDMEPWSSCIDEKKAEEEDVQDEEEEASFPPPPPPVFFKEDMENGASTSSSQQSDSPMNVHTSAQENSVPVSEPSQDKTKVGQSRFAQAVAMAVQRSRLQSLNEDMGSRVPNNSHDALPSPSRSTYQHGPQQTMAHWSDSIQL
nr:protein cordon-bleu isoform X1 [Nothobranchius furzeri]XP_054599227.1 protein cordon-bleu isoform X1 [Nothobranchius furzeri]